MKRETNVAAVIVTREATFFRVITAFLASIVKSLGTVLSIIDSLVVNDYLLFGVELVEKFHLRRPLLCTDTRLFRLNLTKNDQYTKIMIII